MSTPRILLVEDDAQLGAQIVSHFERAGFECIWVRDGDEARRAPVSEMDLVVLDLMLPGTYGMDLLKLYRQRSEVPVMILSARDDSADKVRALKLGADDYVTKPFWPEELLARVTARLRRPTMERSDVLRLGALAIEVEARRVEVDGALVELTPAEWTVLAALAKRPGTAVSRETLVDQALDAEREGALRSLDVHISRLRKKLGRAGPQVATVWGVGYRLAELAPDAPDAPRTPGARK